MPTTLMEFLTIGGVSLVLGFLQSYAVEYWPRWATFQPQHKRLILMAVSVALTLAVHLANTYVPDAVITDLNVWYVVITAGIQLAGAQYSHQHMPKATDKQ